MASVQSNAFFLYNPADASRPENEHVLVGVKIQPSAPPDITRRRPFHLALVLDTSGSMEGPRMTALGRTLHLLIDELYRHDRLTIVEYNNEARILAVDVVVSNEGRTQLHTIVNGLVADGGTNLEAAFGELYRIVQNPAVTPIDSVFILTDGHINNGMTNSRGLMSLLMRALPEGTPVNTLGYGADHNARLLRDMSMRSSGSYTFADADEMLPAIIGDITGGLAAEVGRGAMLMLPPGWSCMELGAKPNADTYTFGHLVAEKTHWILLKGPLRNQYVPTQFMLSYTYDCESYTSNINIDGVQTVDVAVQRDRVRVATMFGRVMEMMEAGQMDNARRDLDVLAAELDASEGKHDLMAVRLRAQVEEMLDSLRAAIRPGPLQRVPYLGSMISRLASDMSALGNQRGLLSSRVSTVVDDPIENTALFSSPLQRRTTTSMTQRYEDIVNHE